MFLSLNVAFFITGCLILGFGASAVFGRNKQLLVLLNFDLKGELHEEGQGVLYQVATVVMAGGVLIVLLFFLGFVGVLLGNQAMLNIYSATLFLVILTQISILVLAVTYRQQVQENLTEQLLKGMKKYYDGRFNSPHPFSVAFDYAQVYFGCCGITGYKDFKKTRWKGAVLITEPPPSNQTAVEGGNATAVITTEPPSNQTAVEGGNATTTTDTSSHSVSEFPITCCRLKDPAAFLGAAVSEWSAKVETFDPTCHKRVPSRDNEYTGFPCIEKVRRFLLGKVKTIIYCIIAIIGLEVTGALSACTIVRDIQDRQILHY